MGIELPTRASELMRECVFINRKTGELDSFYVYPSETRHGWFEVKTLDGKSYMRRDFSVVEKSFARSVGRASRRDDNFIVGTVGYLTRKYGLVSYLEGLTFQYGGEDWQYEWVKGYVGSTERFGVINYVMYDSLHFKITREDDGTFLVVGRIVYGTYGRGVNRDYLARPAKNELIFKSIVIQGEENAIDLFKKTVKRYAKYSSVEQLREV